MERYCKVKILNKVKSILKNNQKLVSFIGLSYFDKMVIFLLPLMVLTLFRDKTVYVSIEYIYSLVIIVVPFLDLGLGGYFFYAYRNEKNKRKVVSEILKLFHLLYLVVFIVGLLFILIHYFVFPFEEYIFYIVSRSIFILAFAFLTSYYRLINKPHKALFVTISANILSLSFLFLYFVFDMEFNLWLIFIGQIGFCIIYLFKIMYRTFVKRRKAYQSFYKLKLVKASLLFSWPNIIQVFILMYIANYGKINALNNLSVDEGVLLSLSQRFSMLIQLTHTAVVGYLIKEIYVSGDLKEIKKNTFFKYLGLLFSAVVFVLIAIIGYNFFNGYSHDFKFLVLIISLIVGYTFLWCLYSYFEIYYSRENKNIIKMYLALINGVIFVAIFSLVNLGYLERITLAMFVSTFITLIISLIILKSKKYRISIVI